MASSRELRGSDVIFLREAEGEVGRKGSGAQSYVDQVGPLRAGVSPWSRAMSQVVTKAS